MFIGYNYNTKTTFVGRLHIKTDLQICSVCFSLQYLACIIALYYCLGAVQTRQCLQLPQYLLGTVLLSVEALGSSAYLHSVQGEFSDKGPEAEMPG